MMQPFRLVRLVLAACAAPPAVLLAQGGAPYAEAPAPAAYADAVDSARALVLRFMQDKGVVGLSIAVGVDGRIVWSEGFGYADVEQRVPVWPTTRFRIGSISKSLTAAAIGLLVQRGQLDLDAPVQRYVPSFPRKRWPVTTRQLAGHLAGIRHYRDNEFLSSRRYGTVPEGLAMFAADSLLFEPGTEYRYSSYGWNLISAVIEGASGQEFLAFMRRNVFEPLGLEHTVADHTDSIVSQRTRSYDRGPGGRLINAPYVDNSYKWAGGGFLSTPGDLVRYAFAFLRPGFLEPATVELLWTSQRTRDGEQTGYGIGWRLGRDAGERRVVSHGGGSVGGRSLLVIYPDQRVALAITANMTRLDYGALPQQVAELFMR